ncbi:MAG: hypothetical protein ACLVAW_10080 [Eisenbergiella massiliensis]
MLRKTRRQILCSPKGSHFASQNKEDWYGNCWWIIWYFLTYLLVIGVMGGILYFVVKAAVKEGMLDALEEWHKEHDGDGSF